MHTSADFGKISTYSNKISVRDRGGSKALPLHWGYARGYVRVSFLSRGRILAQGAGILEHRLQNTRNVETELCLYRRELKGCRVLPAGVWGVPNCFFLSLAAIGGEEKRRQETFREYPVASCLPQRRRPPVKGGSPSPSRSKAFSSRLWSFASVSGPRAKKGALEKA
jgi:hypothetical protein